MSKITIPETRDQMIKGLNRVDQLLTATQWKKAAIVYAFTTHEIKGGHRTAVKSPQLSCREFADLKITGLRSDQTVRNYRQAWQRAVNEADADPNVTPGDVVDLPTIPWKDENDLSDFPDVSDAQAKVLLKVPSYRRQEVWDKARGESEKGWPTAKELQHAGELVQALPKPKPRRREPEGEPDPMTENQVGKLQKSAKEEDREPSHLEAIRLASDILDRGEEFAKIVYEILRTELDLSEAETDDAGPEDGPVNLDKLRKGRRSTVGKPVRNDHVGDATGLPSRVRAPAR